MKAHHLPDAGACPCCGVRLTGATGLTGDAKPTTGDLSICAYCLTPLQFEDGARFRALSPEDLEALPPDERDGLNDAYRAALLAKARRLPL